MEERYTIGSIIRKLKGIKGKENIEDSVNNQFCMRMQAIVDYKTGKLDVFQERKMLEEALN